MESIDEEYVRGTAGWRHLAHLPPASAIAEACRGAGDPAVLAWLAESLDLDSSCLVVDIGGGLGGTSAWLRTHYGCEAITVDPVTEAARCAADVFDLHSVVAVGGHLPLRASSAHAALLLAVLSVVDDPSAVLAEAARLAPRLGLLAYLSTGPDPVRCGGSTFMTEDELREILDAVGWRLVGDLATSGLPTPVAWSAPKSLVGPASDPREDAVGRAIDEGRIEARVAIACNAGAGPEVLPVLAENSPTPALHRLHGGAKHDSL